MLFNSKYPIIAMAMNRVSDLKLAIATSKAGAVPSISAFNYYTGPGKLSYDWLRKNIKQFYKECPNADLIISIDTQFLIDEESTMCDLLIEEKVSHVELIQVDELYRSNEAVVTSHQSRMQDSGIKLILKVVSVPTDISRYARWAGNRQVDALGIKSPHGAGRAGDAKGIEFCINYAREYYSGIDIIAVGGVGTKEDIKSMTELGADYVGIGTLFAATEESPLSNEAKNQLVNKNAETLGKLQTESAKQNALIFSEYKGKDNDNNTFSLHAGITTGTTGHVFAGKGISHITSIVTVNTLVQSLI